jgi:dimethylhistidine N-methyltransferase
VLSGADAAQFAADVEFYLTQDPRQLPSRYLYDSLGSALFDAICRLPWYRITAAEASLLGAHGDDVLRRAGRGSRVVELGPGNGEKLRTLLDSEHGSGRHDVHLVDVSSAALDLAARTIAATDRVRIWKHRASYESGLGLVTRDRQAEERLLLLFLGSNIGNFDPPGANAFLRTLRNQLRAGDLLLIGVDLVKPEAELLMAYDDPLGVTAAFNRNLLVRINHELGGNFDLHNFTHRAVWNSEESRVEMHLVAGRAQEVHVRTAGLTFEMSAGDTIWTESSYKYRDSEIAERLGAAGFRAIEQWVDFDARFALTLAEA